MSPYNNTDYLHASTTGSIYGNQNMQLYSNNAKTDICAQLSS